MMNTAELMGMGCYFLQYFSTLAFYFLQYFLHELMGTACPCHALGKRWRATCKKRQPLSIDGHEIGLGSSTKQAPAPKIMRLDRFVAVWQLLLWLSSKH